MLPLMKRLTEPGTDRSPSSAKWSHPQRVSCDDQLREAEKGARVRYTAGARRVWLFGLIAKGRRLGVHSDFDFAFRLSHQAGADRLRLNQMADELDAEAFMESDARRR
jgi:hypothetical protein